MPGYNSSDDADTSGRSYQRDLADARLQCQQHLAALELAGSRPDVSPVTRKNPDHPAAALHSSIMTYYGMIKPYRDEIEEIWQDRVLGTAQVAFDGDGDARQPAPQVVTGHRQQSDGSTAVVLERSSTRQQPAADATGPEYRRVTFEGLSSVELLQGREVEFEEETPGYGSGGTREVTRRVWMPPAIAGAAFDALTDAQVTLGLAPVIEGDDPHGRT